MSGPREGPNPLRPYYIPPSVGPPLDTSQNISSAHTIGSKHASASKPPTSFGSSARDILSDLDYSEYLSDSSSPSPADVIKRLVDQALWKYTSVLLAQPFEVAKTVLQVQLASAVDDGRLQAEMAEDMRRHPASYREEVHDIPSDGSDPDEPSYFTSAAPLSQTHTRSPRPRHRDTRSSTSYSPPLTPRSPYPPSRSPAHAHNLPSTSSISIVLSHLWTSEGAWGIWKGANSTFIHSIILSTITSFVRSLLCALLALPDPGISLQGITPALIPTPSTVGGIDVLSSPSPFASLFAAVSAAGIAGIVLAPIDIARTKLILTPSTHPPRSLVPTLQSLPSWTLPLSIAPVTFLHSTLPTLISASTPLFLRSRLGIDPLLTPNMYTIATFVSQVFELGIRLPIETVLRRGQIAVINPLSRPPTPETSTLSKSLAKRSSSVQTVVEIGPYRGLVGTIYHIVFEEGERGGRADVVRGTGGAPALKVGAVGQGQQRRRKGQGLEGLWRGWRVGMWGLVGMWGATTLGGLGGKGGEF
ncbi:mitochondrial fusion and transport protein ugo1 [Lignoscripta atroalba]|nr:mitochondrial fusion and transport protein ugo1 [Lignoscripta atroalba]